MNFPVLIAILFSFTDHVRAVWYPICISEKKSDCGYCFQIPYLTVPPPEEPPPVEEPIILEISLETIIQDTISTVADQIQIYKERLHDLHPYIKKIRYFPDLQATVKKVKESREREYLIVLSCVLAAYLILYLYLTKNLCMFYMRTVQSTYSRNLEKFLLENKNDQ